MEVVGCREGEEAKEMEGNLATLESSFFFLSLSLSHARARILRSLSLSLFWSLAFSPFRYSQELYKGLSHSNAHGNTNRYDALFWKFIGFSRSFSNFASSTFVHEIA